MPSGTIMVTEAALHELWKSYSKFTDRPKETQGKEEMQVARGWNFNKETPSKVLLKQQVTELPVKAEYGIS